MDKLKQKQREALLHLYMCSHEDKKLMEAIKNEAQKRGLEPDDFIRDISKDKEKLIEWLREVYPPAIEAYKLHLHEGISRIGQNLQKIPGELNGNNQSLELKFGNNEYVRFNFSKDDNYKNLAKLSSTISKTFDFVLWKIGEARDCFFSCELNEYFDFIGVQRRKENIETLRDVLRFLSSCELFFKTKIKDKKTNKMKEVSGFGNAFAWTLIKHDPGNPDSQYENLQIATTPTWAETIINNKAFTKIDHMLPKIRTDKYPYAYMIGRKLFERYRNNAQKRKGEETEILSLKILLEAMNLSKRLISRGYSSQINTLEKSLDKLAEEKIIEWKYRDNYKKPKDKVKGYITYKPLSKDVLSINKSKVGAKHE